MKTAGDRRQPQETPQLATGDQKRPQREDVKLQI